MKRKILLLTTAVLLSMASAFAQIAINGIYYNLSGTTAEVTSHQGGGYSGNIVIPNAVTYNAATYTVTSIGASAFINSNIISVIIPTSVISIGSAAFNGCLDLEEVDIKGGTNISLTFLGAGYSNPGTHFENSGVITLRLGRDLTLGYTNNVPHNISPFKGCKKLKEVIIGNDVTRINDESFYNCEKLQFLTLGNKLKTIGSQAFFNCPKLESPLNLPEGFLTIGRSAFEGCEQLPSLFIPNSVETIGSAAFNECLVLAEVEIEGGTNISLTFLGAGYSNPGTHFENSGIEILQIGRNFTTGYTSNVPNNVSPFKGSKKIQKVTIWKDVTVLNENTFNGCAKLECIVNLRTTPQSVGNNCFTGVDKTNCGVCVPIGSLNSYKSAEDWKEFVNIIEGVSCEYVPPFIELPGGTVVNFGVDGGEKEIIVKSNISWSVSVSGKNTSWLTVSPNSGTGDGSFTLKAEKNECNPERENKVTIFGGGITKTINVSQDACVGIEDFLAGKLHIYPNPTTNKLRISGELIISNVEIFDIYGKNVGVNRQDFPENSGNEILLSISHLSAGVYFVKINTEVGQMIKKVLKE